MAGTHYQVGKNGAFPAYDFTENPNRYFFRDFFVPCFITHAQRHKPQHELHLRNPTSVQIRRGNRFLLILLYNQKEVKIKQNTSRRGHLEKSGNKWEFDAWNDLIRAAGFRAAAVAFLKEQLTAARDRHKLKNTIKRLRKYEPDLEIVKHLLKNHHWKNTVKKIIEHLPHTNADPEVLFVFRGGGNVPTVPAADGKKIYFGSGQTLYAIDAVSGQVSWRKRNPQKSWYPVFLGNKTLYASSGKNMFAIEKRSGRILWTFRSDKHLTAPLCCNSLVFAGTLEGTLYALDCQSGKKLWTFNAARRIDVATGTWKDIVPAVSEEGVAYGIRSTDGECTWHFRAPGKIGSLPAVGEGLVVFGTENHKICALLANSGQLFWEFTTKGRVYATPCISDNIVYCGSRDRHLYALDAETGKEVWRFKALGYVSSPTIQGKMVYFSTPGRIYSVSAEDHKMRWCFPLGFPVATPPVLHGRFLYTGTVEGQMLCLRLTENLNEQTAAIVLKKFLKDY